MCFRQGGFEAYEQQRLADEAAKLEAAALAHAERLAAQQTPNSQNNAAAANQSSVQAPGGTLDGGNSRPSL